MYGNKTVESEYRFRTIPYWREMISDLFDTPREYKAISKQMTLEGFEFIDKSDEFKISYILEKENRGK